MPALRENLLVGRRVALGAEAGAVMEEALAKLGAEVELLTVTGLDDDEDRLGEWAQARAPLDALVYSAASEFGSGGAGGLRAVLQEAWVAAREVATGAMIDSERPGKLVLVAPRSQAGPMAQAAQAGLDNLVRTLSVEWARYGLTAALIVPGERSTEAEIAALACFLVSEAGEYVSGCRLELGSLT